LAKQSRLPVVTAVLLVTGALAAAESTPAIRGGEGYEAGARWLDAGQNQRAISLFQQQLNDDPLSIVAADGLLEASQRLCSLEAGLAWLDSIGFTSTQTTNARHAFFNAHHRRQQRDFGRAADGFRHAADASLAAGDTLAAALCLARVGRCAVAARNAEAASLAAASLNSMASTIEGASRLTVEADWPAAQPRLERAFRENVLPEVVRAGSVARREKPLFWARWQIRWMAPAAAAAAVLLVVFLSDRIQSPGTLSEDLGPMRGTPVDTPDITLEKPFGNVTAAPNEFEWTPRSKDDYYTIEIFTSNLDKVFEVARVPDTRWAVTDSLRNILERDIVYLWSITGHKGIEPVTVSPNAWFKITDEKP